MPNREDEPAFQPPQIDFESIAEEPQPSVGTDAGEEAQREVDGFELFRALGGSFYRQKERQIITMDNNGGLHYEQRDEQNKTTNTNQLRSFKMGHAKADHIFNGTGMEPSDDV